MEILISNLFWMAWNIFLAFLGLGFGWLFLKVKTSLLKFFFGGLWLLFVPNTIYTVTDLIHISWQWQALDPLGRLVMAVQQSILVGSGIFTFVWSIRFVEEGLGQLFRKIAKKNWLKSNLFIIQIIVVLNFLIAFGVAMGRMQRTNSWYLFTNPSRVIMDALQTMLSVQLLLFVFLFGVGMNCLYFGLRYRRR